jgi:predicted ATPase
MSKSFLSFSDLRINSTIDKLGVLMGKDINVSVSNLKALEYERLEQASKSAPIRTSKICDSDDNISDTDSDLGWNQQAIQHLVGDIADDILNTNGSRFDDFNLGNRKSKMVQPKRVQRRRKPEIELNISNERDILE